MSMEESSMDQLDPAFRMPQVEIFVRDNRVRRKISTC